MGKELSKITIDGAELNEEQVLDLLNEEEIIPFEYEKRDGKKIAFELLVDATRIDDKALRAYLREVSKLSREATKRSEPTSEEKAETDESEIEEAENALSVSQIEAMADYADLMAALAHLDAELLFPAILAWNVPGREPSVDELCRAKSPGGAALSALKSWYFPTSGDVAAEIGSVEAPNTPATSPTSEATDEKEATLPIS